MRQLGSKDSRTRANLPQNFRLPDMRIADRVLPWRDIHKVIQLHKSYMATDRMASVADSNDQHS